MMNGPNAHILIVEDEEPLSLLLRYNLETKGYEVETRGLAAMTPIRGCGKVRPIWSCSTGCCRVFRGSSCAGGCGRGPKPSRCRSSC